MAEGEGEGEDPFGSIIKFCQVTSSQELKFQSCSFARESESFPDYFDSLETSSPDPAPLEPVGIVIVSPPETDSENNSSIDKSNTEDFLTPPEHHNPSASSSQEDPERLKPVIPIDSKESVSVVAETIAGDDGRVDNKVSVDFGKGQKNLGFSETEKIEGGDEFLEGQCQDGVNEVGGIEGFERELKRFRVFDSELNEPMSKKLRVSEENWDSEMHTLCIDETGIDEKLNDTEVIDLDTEEIDEEIRFDEGKIIIDVDAPVKESEENAEVREHGEAWENVQEVSDTAAESVDEVEKSKNCGPDGDVDQREKENGIDLDGGDKCLELNGNLALKESEEGVKDNSNNEVQRGDKAVSGSGIIEEIEEFRYEGAGNGVDHSATERVARGRRELPSSISGKEMDMRGEKSAGTMKLKSGSWKDLVDALEVVFGKVDDGCENVDFLETAKRRGLTFPQPRWI